MLFIWHVLLYVSRDQYASCKDRQLHAGPQTLSSVLNNTGTISFIAQYNLNRQLPVCVLQDLAAFETFSEISNFSNYKT